MRRQGTWLRIVKWLCTLNALLVATAFAYSLRRAVSWTSQDLRHENSLMVGTLWFSRRTSAWNQSGRCPECGTDVPAPT